jgi:hypothetical protein
VQNLNDIEIARWKLECRKLRQIACSNPCYHVAMASCEDFETALGPWHFRLFMLTAMEPHVWIGSVSYMKEIGDETVYDKETGVPIFNAPKDALIVAGEWTHEEKDIARSLLADLFGPLIHDKHQPVKEETMVFSMNWIVNDKDARRAAAMEN